MRFKPAALTAAAALALATPLAAMSAATAATTTANGPARITVPSNPVAAGKTFTVTVRYAYPRAVRAVYLQTLKNGQWVRGSRTTTGSHRAYNFPMLDGTPGKYLYRGHILLRHHHVANTPRALIRAVAAPTTTPTATLATSQTSANHGSTYTLTVTPTQPSAVVNVTLQHYAAGAWSTVTSEPGNGGASYDFVRTADSIGAQQYRAVVAYSTQTVTTARSSVTEWNWVPVDRLPVYADSGNTNYGAVTVGGQSQTGWYGTKAATSHWSTYWTLGGHCTQFRGDYVLADNSDSGASAEAQVYVFGNPVFDTVLSAGTAPLSKTVSVKGATAVGLTMSNAYYPGASTPAVLGAAAYCDAIPTA